MTLTKKDFIRKARFINSFKSPSVRAKLVKESLREFKRNNPKLSKKILKDFMRKK